ncbi:MAG: hypothetical protein ACOVQ7_04275, partial [Limnoraphis robusta]
TDMLLKFSVRFAILPDSSNGSLSRQSDRYFRLANCLQGIKIETALLGCCLLLRSSNQGFSLL